MIEQPIVSVVIPTYNREELLPAAVESVKAQTLESWELLIVDDHSSDNTRACVERWATADPRVRSLINQRTKGPAGARNTGIDAARGKYVAFLDSDDEWLPHHLQRMVGYLEKFPNRIDIMTANAVRRRRDTGEVYGSRELREPPTFEMLDEAMLFDREAVFDLSLERSIMTTQTLVLRRQLLDEVRFPEDLPPGPEDMFFQYELAFRKPGIAFLNDVHVIYWAHGDNLTLAGDVGDAKSKVPLFLAFEQAVLKLEAAFPLTADQKEKVRRYLARLYFWHLGYNCYAASGDFVAARQYFWRGIRVTPFESAFWKTLFLSYPRQALGWLKRVGAVESRRPAS